MKSERDLPGQSLAAPLRRGASAVKMTLSGYAAKVSRVRFAKSELIDQLAAEFPHVSHVEAERLVTLLLDRIVDRLASGGRVEMRGFGSFSIKIRAAGVGRNSKTGASVKVPIKHIPSFNPFDNECYKQENIKFVACRLQVACYEMLVPTEPVNFFLDNIEFDWL